MAGNHPNSFRFPTLLPNGIQGLRSAGEQMASSHAATTGDVLPVQLCVWGPRCKPHVPVLFCASAGGRFLFTTADGSPQVYVWEHLPVDGSLAPKMVLSCKSQPNIVGLVDYKSTQAKRTAASVPTVSASKADHKLLCVGSNGVVSQWCVETGKCLRLSSCLFAEATRQTLQIKASPEVSRAVLLLHNTWITVIDCRSLQVLTKLVVAEPIVALGVSRGFVLGCLSESMTVQAAALHIQTVARKHNSTTTHKTGNSYGQPSTSTIATRSTEPGDSRQPQRFEVHAQQPRLSSANTASAPRQPSQNLAETVLQEGVFDPLAEFSLPKEARPQDHNEIANRLCWSPKDDAFLIVWPSQWILVSSKWLRPTCSTPSKKSTKPAGLYVHGRPTCPAHEPDPCIEQWGDGHFMLSTDNIIVSDNVGRTFLFHVPKSRRKHTTSRRGQKKPVVPVCQLVSGDDADKVPSQHCFPQNSTFTACTRAHVIKYCPRTKAFLMWRCDLLMESVMGHMSSNDTKNNGSVPRQPTLNVSSHIVLDVGFNWTHSFAQSVGMPTANNVSNIEAWGGVLLSQTILGDTIIQLRPYVSEFARDVFIGVNTNEQHQVQQLCIIDEETVKSLLETGQTSSVHPPNTAFASVVFTKFGAHVVVLASAHNGSSFIGLLSYNTGGIIRLETSLSTAATIHGKIRCISCPQTQPHRTTIVYTLVFDDFQSCPALVMKVAVCEKPWSLRVVSQLCLFGVESAVDDVLWLSERNQVVLCTTSVQYVWSLFSGALERMLPADSPFTEAQRHSQQLIESRSQDEALGFKFLSVRTSTSQLHFGLAKLVLDLFHLQYHVFPAAQWLGVPLLGLAILRSTSALSQRNGFATIYFPTTSDLAVWKRSGPVTAHNLVNLLQLFVKIIESGGDVPQTCIEQANAAVFFLTNQLASVVGSGFVPASQTDLSRLVMSHSRLTHVAARLALNASVTAQGEEDMQKSLKRFTNTRGTVFNASMVVALTFCILHPEWTPPSVAKRFARIVMRGMGDSALDANTRCVLIENFGKGFRLWRPYLKGTSSCIRSLQDLMQVKNSAIRSTALRALLEMGHNSPILIVEMVRAYCGSVVVVAVAVAKCVAVCSFKHKQLNMENPFRQLSSLHLL